MIVLKLLGIIGFVIGYAIGWFGAKAYFALSKARFNRWLEKEREKFEQEQDRLEQERWNAFAEAQKASLAEVQSELFRKLAEVVEGHEQMMAEIQAETDKEEHK